MRTLDLRTVAAGSFVLGAALFLLTWLGSVSVSLSWPWVVQLSMHGLTFVLLGLGFFLAGRQMEVADRLTIVWWVGATLLTIVYLRGAHIGDENSRSLIGLERPLIIVGLALVAIGLASLGGQQLRTSVAGSTRQTKPAPTI